MNNIKKERIKKIIDECDPIDLLPFAPPDEYDYEINKIYSVIEDKVNIEHQYLSEIIYNVFKKTFGEDVFLNTIEDCMIVADSILQSIN